MPTSTPPTIGASRSAHACRRAQDEQASAHAGRSIGRCRLPRASARSAATADRRRDSAAGLGAGIAARRRCHARSSRSAEALGWPLRGQAAGVQAAGARCWRRHSLTSDAGVDRSRSSRLGAPWPGSRSGVRTRERAGGALDPPAVAAAAPASFRSADPGGRLDAYDLVVTTPQYRLPPRAERAPEQRTSASCHRSATERRLAAVGRAACGSAAARGLPCWSAGTAVPTP